ncbi:O-antigen ligase family protein [Herbaspirillum rhizosphaerae]|uniref:O-antigen ligase family protein n=1 Tax=Herbaspirillum rhizosphaerae TaxID=346179 RepID=UPI00067DBE6F|nr:O-antigen ligase family protein [Herbaspirillum rhizosphaerae]
MNYLKLPVIVLVTLFYAFALVVDRSAGVVYSLLLLLAFAGIVLRARPEQKSFFDLLKEYWPLMLAMATPLIAVVAHQLSTGHFAGRSYDAQSRLALFALVFWVMLFIPLQYMKQVQWGLIVGIVLAAIKIYILTEGGKTRYGTDFIPIIIFAELVLLMSVFAVFSIAWDKKHNRVLAALKVLVLLVGFYVAYLSQSRGVWATIPVFAIIAGIAVRNIPSAYKIGVAVLFALCIGGVFQYGSILKERVSVAETDIQQYTSGTQVDTSLGIRFQLWRGSWILFKEHPVFGVGIENYPAALKDLAERKIISPFSASLPHSHNEILFMMARLGIFGLLSVLAVYFVPFYYFARDIRHRDSEVRCAAAMGLALSLGFFTLGLVDVVFLWWECYPYYAISTAFFLAYIVKRKNLLAQQAPANGVAA